MRKEVSQIEDA